MENIFFFQTQQIHDNTNLFDQLKKQNIFYSYFQVDQNYYLFVYAQQSIDINLLYQSVEIIQELDYKQRKIRSFRGFFLYALEILENGKDYEILQTNLQPFFWRKVKNIIRQNKKSAVQEFLFGKNEDSKLDNHTSNPRIKILEDQIQNLSNQVDSLQQKIIELEDNQTLEIKKTLSELLKHSEAAKIGQQTDYTLNPEQSAQSSNLLGNESEINLEVQEPMDEISKSVSEAKIKRVTPLSDSQPSNLPSNPNQAQNEHNFITLGKISEDEKIEIIQKGFQLQAEGKISLKKYYESTDPNSLFQSKGYSIKYETIRKITLFKQFKF